MFTNNTKSVYLHIPFCKSKCYYCSFVSGTSLNNKEKYLKALNKEIDYYYRDQVLDTIYIGGGTPSVLSVKELSSILNKFNYNSHSEITIEVNPNDINESYLSDLTDLGFNRLSIGSQSFDNEILRKIGRRHNSDEIYKSVKNARKAGFNNISLDLIYGLPSQTIDDFRSDLTKAVSLGVEHLSLYGLKIDKGCYFYEHLPENLPNDDTQADMYLLANEMMLKSKYEHYEVSNYSKKGFSSKHNTNYWKCGNYYGFGLSAHGYINDIRYSNTVDIDEYINNPITHKTEKVLSDSEKLEEKIFLGFRLSSGLNTKEINSEFGIDFDKKYRHILEKYLSSGHLIKTETGYSLNNSPNSNGFLLSNIILSEFID